MRIKDDKNKSYWNKIYMDIADKEIKYDLWLDKFKSIFNEYKGTEIVDLGCGTGNNCLYLSELGYSVVACDYSTEALKIVNKYLPKVKILEFDFTKDFPFENASVNIIIADLSLHYFSEKITKKILSNIRRILTKGGYLILRVNSINDTNYGAGNGVEVERHLYDTKYGYKRFFDEKDIKYFCGEWNILHLKENKIYRYGMEKYVFEVVLMN